MEFMLRIFPYAKTITGIRQVFDQSHLFTDATAARARKNVTSPQPWSSSSLMTSVPGGKCCGCMGGGGNGGDGGDPCSFFQTQAAKTALQSQEGPAMPRMAILLGLMGIGMSGYSSRQLALHYKPSSHLFR